ncbi:glycerate kinase [Microlunatus soli]|uniref:Glycerate kinase n=1 Tax=Microlunatus soli TaxID=630515 RepID=A0A1H1M7N6_9ACTN|nr:glycerate kinase [Microlunatus soli]SDR82811.1 glycerate kinase [Microlunatus soli]
MPSHQSDVFPEIPETAPSATGEDHNDDQLPSRRRADDHGGSDDHGRSTLRVLVAPDSFKGSLSAADAATAIAAGWRRVRPSDELQQIPLADGGEGTVDAIAAARPDGVRHVVDGLTGPDGRPVAASWLQLGSDTAVIEMAAVAGLPLMAEPDAVGSTTRGLGELIGAALDAGMSTVIVGAGGSATTDGGAGALVALGLELLDPDGAPIPDGGAGLQRLATVRGAARRPAKLIMLSDVDAPLLGEHGAAAVFGPQKGADAAQIGLLDGALRQFAIALGGSHDLPGMGAAGGLGYGLVSGLGAEIVPGAAYLSELAGLDRAIGSADVVITGEGRFDATSLGGKVVGHVFELLDRAGPEIPTERFVVAGQIGLHPEGVHTWGLADLAGSVDAAIAEPARWLSEAGASAASRL